MLLYAYFTPKVDFKRNLTTTNRFFTNDDWQRGRFENFESYHQYESNLESDVRFEIESNHESSQVPNDDIELWNVLSSVRIVRKKRKYCWLIDMIFVML